MKQYRLPGNWASLGWVQKASYLCSTRQARDYSEACSVLASFRKRRVQPTVQAAVARQEQLKLW